MLAKEPEGRSRDGKVSRGRIRGSGLRVLLCRANAEVSIENDPFPFCRAALVSVLRAPLISRGLKDEKETKREDNPSSDILVRSGRVGISADCTYEGEDVPLGVVLCVGEYVDILLEGEIDCVDFGLTV